MAKKPSPAAEAAPEPTTYADLLRGVLNGKFSFTIMPTSQEIRVVGYFGDLASSKTLVLPFAPGWEEQAVKELEIWRRRVKPDAA